MDSIFLSASVPKAGRGNYFETADPYLIQFAVRELVIAILGRKRLIWGGHPAITPMIWAVCEDLGVNYSTAVTLYQSLYFKDIFPTENKKFRNVIFTPSINNDMAASLERMRFDMFSQNDFYAAVFIGGMEGIKVEYQMFSELHPKGKILPVGSPGGASRDIAIELEMPDVILDSIDFVKLFYSELNLSQDTPRNILTG